MWTRRPKPEDLTPKAAQGPAPTTGIDPYQMTDPMLLQGVESYWRGLFSGDRLPERTAIDPGKLGAAIEDSMILEKVAPGIARIRVAGQNLHTLFGTEPRGVPLSFVMRPAARAELAHAVEACFNKPALVELPIEAARAPREPQLGGRLLLLPLLDGFGRTTRALTVLALSGQMGKGHRRFDIPADSGKRVEPLGATCEKQKAEHPPTLRLVVDNTP